MAMNNRFSAEGISIGVYFGNTFEFEEMEVKEMQCRGSLLFGSTTTLHTPPNTTVAIIMNQALSNPRPSNPRLSNQAALNQASLNPCTSNQALLNQRCGCGFRRM